MPPGDRLDLLREAVGTAMVPVEIEHHGAPEEVSAWGAGRQLGRLSVLTVTTRRLTLRRTARLARLDAQPSVLLEMQRAGRRTVTQADRRAVLHPGDLSLLDTSRPYVSDNVDGTEQYCVRVPRAELALTDRALSGVAGLRLGPRDPVACLAASYLSRIVGDDRLAAQADLAAFEAATVELIRAVIATRVDDVPAREPVGNTLAYQIMEFIRQHLTDHDLTAAKIAQAHHISVRHLYTVLSRSGVVLGEWIRGHRLEGCRRDLARVGAHAQTISAVARHWGFDDATHFSRSFRNAFGMSPREWRFLHQNRDGTQG
jgi:AraC-like DNA-binding protein